MRCYRADVFTGRATLLSLFLLGPSHHTLSSPGKLSRPTASKPRQAMHTTCSVAMARRPGSIPSISASTVTSADRDAHVDPFICLPRKNPSLLSSVSQQPDHPNRPIHFRFHNVAALEEERPQSQPVHRSKCYATLRRPRQLLGPRLPCKLDPLPATLSHHHHPTPLQVPVDSTSIEVPIRPSPPPLCRPHVLALSRMAHMCVSQCLGCLAPHRQSRLRCAGSLSDDLAFNAVSVILFNRTTRVCPSPLDITIPTA
ncbi:hypothetical protein EV126DRAFT_256110 [Verticillium dahliae]|nr:hypothetical protein EV126DRAFT_256110 [Verticillium dahliae]